MIPDDSGRVVGGFLTKRFFLGSSVVDRWQRKKRGGIDL